MFSQFLPKLRTEKITRRSLKKSQEVFHRAYDTLKSPITLCQGQRIVAANQAAQELLLPIAAHPEGMLVETVLGDKSKANELFGNPDKEMNFKFKQLSLSITAQPWNKHPQLWILEWTDKSTIARLSAQLKSSQNCDPITGALFPLAFTRQLDKRLTQVSFGALAYIALDCASPCDEKRDNILVKLIDQITREFGNNILLSRSDPATLSIFLETQENQEEARRILQQFNRICRRVLFPTSATLALATFPFAGNTREQLMEATRLALEQAQQSKTPTLFKTEFREAAIRRKRLIDDMPAALAKNEITPHFQPIINSITGHIKGFEALIRWVHPELGYIIPPDIIEVAQDANLLHTITAHVMSETMKQMALWPDEVQFAVNVTPSQMSDELVDLVQETVTNAGIKPDRFEIEVTEDALFKDFEFSVTIFARLRAIGVAVAMDDFGAGYTSVGNLRKLEFTKIKIDKSISDGLPNDKRSIAIFKSLMYMANELGVEVTVEGIEEENQLEFLRGFDCGVQGFVFSRPIPARDLPQLRKFLPPSVLRKSNKEKAKKGPVKAKAKTAAGLH